MELMKKIIYTLLGLILASAVILVGVILFAEYSGRRFSPGTMQKMAGLEQEDSRLVYDENGDIAELPSTASSQDEATSTLVSEFGDSSPTGTNDGAGEALTNEVPASETSEPDPNDNIERTYIMDMGSNIFHTADCPYAENLADGDRSEMTTTRTQVLNAGYAPCTNCNP